MQNLYACLLLTEGGHDHREKQINGYYLLTKPFGWNPWVKIKNAIKKHNTITIFIRIVAVATINFSLAGVRLLIEGSSYSRTSLIILERYLPLPSIKILRQHERLTSLRITEIWSKNKQPCWLRTKPRTSSAMFLPRTNDRPPLAIVATPT